MEFHEPSMTRRDSSLTLMPTEISDYTQGLQEPVRRLSTASELVRGGAGKPISEGVSRCSEASYKRQFLGGIAVRLCRPPLNF